jgi:poly-gamma-glutamate capsule biosynthesis protein CapA/YwtB (metallophosphatase superfamily)
VVHSEVSILLAGDALITRPWSHICDVAFLRLIDEIRDADVAIANLETVIHEFKGYAQADSGGTYMASAPWIAAELKWAGFDMVAHANNHSFDYGTSGVLETIDHVERAGLVLAGSGKDLQNARAPRYFRCDGGTVALVAMASDFVPYGKASLSRSDLRGRPGVNPLALVQERSILMPHRAAERLDGLVSLIAQKPSNLDGASFQFGRFGVRFRASDHYGLCTGMWAVETDLIANLEAISEAASNAEIVVVSVHAHRQGQWLAKFAHQAIDRGAHVIFIHGPHRVGGIELYHGKPIFYSTGNFVYEAEHIGRFPSEAYEQLGLAPDATLSNLREARGKSGLWRDRSAFEGFAALISIIEGKVMRIRLIPTDLQFDAEGNGRGRPQLASRELGKGIIDAISARSRSYGTLVGYDLEANCGEVFMLDAKKAFSFFRKCESNARRVAGALTR